MHRNIGLLGLTFVAISGILGSGWLFAPLLAAQAAGPSALIAWGIGGFSMLLLAATFAEISTILPVAGGIGRVPHFSHGSVVSMTMGWTAWVGYNTTATIEVEAVLRYSKTLAPWLYGSDGLLSAAGLGVACFLLLVFTVLNAFGVKFFARLNTALTWVKILVPGLLAAVILASEFRYANFSAYGGFAPEGIKGILSAISTGGVIFALIGFRHVIDMAGEAKNPKVNVPLALVLSLLVSLLIYGGLQLAFLGALDETQLQGGWHSLSFPGELGPMASLATAVGALWIVSILDTSARISSFASGLVSVGSNARLGLAMAQNGLFPKFMETLSERGVPLFALMVNFVVSALFFIALPFKEVLALNTSSIVLSFVVGPVAVLAFRRLLPDTPRAFVLPAAPFTGCFAFIVASLIIYWSGWNTMGHLGICLAVGFCLMAFRVTRGGVESLDWREALWLAPYLAGLMVLSYLGTFGGGAGLIPVGPDILAVGLLATAVYVLAFRLALKPEKFERYMAEEFKDEVEEYGAGGEGPLEEPGAKY
ncbi:APC family permease [Roseibium aggregatum]|uniref:APC family permease n=1 Tax=Roseibium aggregatum TaxID=187304 RepID=A0A939EEG2_9HYPH|nr:APC family permease [Roseibium aggregatum]MBN9671271.1 APC family permease [Roseibium aggregatum]